MSEKVLIINSPVPRHVWQKYDIYQGCPPLGPLYVCSYLERHGYETEFIDLMAQQLRKADFVSRLCELNPIMVGISLNIANPDLPLRLARLTKEVLPECPVVFGGGFLPFCWKQFLADPAVDYVVLREGEETALELVRHLRESPAYLPDYITGLVWKENGNFRENPSRDYIKDIDALPFPKRTPDMAQIYREPASIICSRGCPYECIFCASPRIWQRKTRMRQPRFIMAEIEEVLALYPDHDLFIGDDTLTIRRDYLLELCRLLQDSGIGCRWTASCRADQVDGELLHRMYDAGCRKVLFGMESGDNGILESIKKHLTVEVVEEAVKAAAGAGLRVSCSYIIGHAMDTPETVRKTIALARRLEENYGARSSCFINIPFPGSEQFERAEELGMEIDVEAAFDSMYRLPLRKTRYLPRELFEGFRHGPTSDLHWILQTLEKYG